MWDAWVCREMGHIVNVAHEGAYHHVIFEGH